MGRMIAGAFYRVRKQTSRSARLRAESIRGSSAYAHLPDQNEVAEAVSEIAALGGEARAFPLHLRDPASVEQFHTATLDAFGPVDILINAAGVLAQAPW